MERHDAHQIQCGVVIATSGTPTRRCTNYATGYTAFLSAAEKRVSDFYACNEHRLKRHKDIVGPPPPVCEMCGSTEGVQWEDSRTAYAPGPKTAWRHLLSNVGEKDIDPNAPKALCRSCAEDHHAHWDEMWAEYDRSRL